MPTTFDDWKVAYAAATASQPNRYARLVILEKETRIAPALTLFKAALATAFGTRLDRGEAPPDAAVDALEDGIDLISRQRNRFCLLLPLPSPGYSQGRNHVSVRYLTRFSTVGDFDERAPPKRLPATASQVFGAKPIVWITPDDCPDAPDEVAKRLGLPHFEGQFAYRMNLAVADIRQFIPSCLDAELFPAWQEPPAGHTGPCGMTRHLETGQRIYNEFIIVSHDLGLQALGLELLPLSGPPTRVGRLSPDYLSNR